MPIRILGAGPAGAAAALAALAEGRTVEIAEQSRLPRHKVCGEFLSPETAPLFDELGVAGAVAAARPARIDRLILHFGDFERRARLPEPALGLSRYALDKLLLDRASSLGAALESGRGSGPVDVRATGRRSLASGGERLFGFKAHYRGPAGDAVELFFFDGAYAGVSPVEDGITNVCGLAPEGLLRARGFEIDEFVAGAGPLAERVKPLARTLKWLVTGPVAFRPRFEATAEYRCGDALAFIDPFTGSGILNALLTGRLAGHAAARAIPPAEYVRQCRQALARPLLMAELLRGAIGRGWGSWSRFIPARWLFRLTRPSLAA